MQVLKKIQLLLSLIPKVYRMPPQVNNPAMTQEKKFGIKRQIATDKIGCLLSVLAHKANQHDTKIGIWVAMFALFFYSTIKKFCADGGYRKTFVAQVKEFFCLEVEISKKITPHGWRVISPRWVVERIFA